MKRTGVASFQLHMARPNNWLKRYGLFFDRVDVIDLDIALHMHKAGPHRKDSVVNDLDWLVDIGFIGNSSKVEIDVSRLSEKNGKDLASAKLDFDQEVARYKELDKQYLAIRKKLGFESFGTVPKQAEPILTEISEASDNCAALLSRYVALQHRFSGAADSTCLEVQPSAFLRTGVDDNIDTQKLLSIMLESVPVPSERVPWQDIIQFRDSSENMASRALLRQWIKKMITGGITYGEADEIIQSALQKYRDEVRRSGIDFVLSTTETLTTAVVGIIQDALSFKLDRIPSRIFKIVRSIPGLRNSEKSLVNAELSYLVKIEDEFSR